MKKNLSAAAALFFSAVMYSQVGINNASPKATLDITAKSTNGTTAEGIIPPRLTGDQMKASDANYGNDQKGAIVYVTAAVSSVSTKTVNITAEGYYYFDGGVWQKMGNGAAANSWGLNGNAGTDPAVNFIGTTGTGEHLVFKTAGSKSGLIMDSTSGQGNTALGSRALNLNANNYNSTYYNTAFGSGALASNTGNNNTAVGTDAASTVTSGNYNTAVGRGSFNHSTTGSYNTALGYSTLSGNTIGNKNVGIGNSAGSNITTGNNNIIIGTDQSAISPTDSNQLNIGGAIFGTGLGGNANAPAGNIGLGTALPQSRLHIVGDGGAGDDITINSGSNSATSSGLYAFSRSRGSYTIPTAVTDGDWLGSGSYQGYDGTSYQGGARIAALVNGTVSSGNVPTDLFFSTGSTTIDERMRIASNGNIGIGITSPSQKMDIDGTARLRNIPSSGGTVMLTADNDGVIRKQALPVSSAPTIFPSAMTAGVNLNSSNWSNPNYTGTAITLPANSKYIVNVMELLGTNNYMPAGQSVWVQSTFSDNASTFQYSGDIQGSSLISGTWNSSSLYGIVSGAIILNNTSSSAKTYYYWVKMISSNGYTGNINNFGGSGWAENQIYAIPVN